jgi:uncharacterized membrane protein (Fun14 family)
MNAFQWSKQIIQRAKPASLKSVVISTFATTGTVTLCEGSAGGNGDDILSKIKDAVSNPSNLFDIDAIGKTLGSKVQDAIDSGVPTEISYGFLCGYSSGYALKKVGKMASVVFGLGFVTLQSLSYSGYLQINHAALKRDVENVLDLNDDGKLDDKDINAAYTKLMEILQFNMTGGTGFVTGFLGGFKSG